MVVYSSEFRLDHVHTALDKCNLPLNFHFPDTKHVKHKYIYLRYPWDPEFRITEKGNIPIGTITNSSLKLHTD